MNPLKNPKNSPVLNIIASKKILQSLNKLAVQHLMNEDIEFYKLLKDQKRLTPTSEVYIKEFTHTFKSTKLKLMNFLTTYTRDEAVLDEEFFQTFNQLVAVLVERINFEEKNLYSLLHNKR